MSAQVPQGGTQSQPAQPEREQPAEAPAVDPNRLGVDVGRIGRQLRQSAQRESFDGQTLRYEVDVYGQLPRLQFITPQDDLVYGPVPFSAPTHQDMLNIVTPLPFRAPAADFSSFLRWLSNRDRKK